MILSFCIPTYGQPAHLRRTLDSLVGQNLEGVEIVIRDDNPDSESEAVVSEYVARLPIRYFHMRKEGVDRAFLFLSREAKGQFVWWFGDDVLCPGAIARVTEFLRQDDGLDFMYLNSIDLSGGAYSIALGGSRFFKDRDEVLLKLKDQLGFCSAMLFQKELLQTGLERAEKFVGSSWVTLFLVLNVLALGERFYFLDGKNFASDPKHVGEARWYDPFEVHGINFCVIVQQFRNSFDQGIMRNVLADKFGRAWRSVVVERARGFKNGFAAASPRIGKLVQLYWSYPEFYIALPFMLTPRPILQLCYGFYKRFLDRRR